MNIEGQKIVRIRRLTKAELNMFGWEAEHKLFRFANIAWIDEETGELWASDQNDQLICVPQKGGWH
jgi:hypothetical protein